MFSFETWQPIWPCPAKGFLGSTFGVDVIAMLGAILIHAVHPSSKFESFLGGGFKHFLFSPLPGEMIQFD